MSSLRRALAATLLLAAGRGWGTARADVHPAFEPGGRLLCAARSGARRAVAAVPDGSGGHLLVVQDGALDPARPDTAGIDLGLLRIAADLAPLEGGSPTAASEPCGTLLLGGDGDQSAAILLPDARGGLLLGGAEVDTARWGEARVFAAGFDAGGAALFSPALTLPADPSIASRWAFGASDGDGGLLLGWQEDAAPGILGGPVSVRRIDGRGIPVWGSPVRLSGTGVPDATFAALAPDGTGGAYASWRELRESEPDRDFHPRLQRVGADGTALWAAGGVRVDPDHGIQPPVALLPDPRGILVAFLADAPRLQLLTADGSPAWGRSGVRLADPNGAAWRSDVALHRGPGGSLYVTWIERLEDESGRLVALRLSPDGAPLWPEPAPLLVHPHAILGRSEAVLEDGTLAAAAVLWQPDLADDPSDLAAQVIDPRGRVKTTLAGMALAAAPRSQTAPLMFSAAPNGAPEAQVVWSDDRFGTGDGVFQAYYVQALQVTTFPRLEPEAVALRQGDTVEATLLGDDLRPGLLLDAGRGVRAEALEVAPIGAEGPGDRVRARLSAEPWAAVGAHDLRLLNPDGSTAGLTGAIDVSLDPRRADIDGSGRADGLDLAILAAAFGRRAEDPGYDQSADIDGSGLVDGLDLAILAARFGAP